MVLQHRCRWRQYLYRPPRVPEIQIRQQRRERGNNNLERKHFLCLFSRFPGRRRGGDDVYGGAGMGGGGMVRAGERAGGAEWSGWLAGRPFSMPRQRRRQEKPLLQWDTVSLPKIRLVNGECFYNFCE